MTTLNTEVVLSVHHWTDTLFSFKTSRNSGFRFENGHFTMIGVENEGRPLLRPYSIVSANYEDNLEFFSIKVPDGPLTSRLQNIKPGDSVYVSRKPTGTLVQSNLLPGKHLYLISTGTGLAPFLSIVKDPEIYEIYDKVILAHGVRQVAELAYQDILREELPKNKYFGDMVKDKLIYYPTVTREPFYNNGRLTDLIETGRLSKAVGLPDLDVDSDRFMICGGSAMLKQFCAILNAKGFQETRNGILGNYVIERAFIQ